MNFTLPQDLKLEGQKFVFNTESNVVAMDIPQPFMTAGDKVGWDTKTFSKVGFGVNKAILNFIETRKTRFVITVVIWNFKHWVNYDKLRHFRKFQPCTYSTNGKEIFVFPKTLFSDKPTKEISE
jgi:hypothetical protein